MTSLKTEVSVESHPIILICLPRILAVRVPSCEYIKTDISTFPYDSELVNLYYSRRLGTLRAVINATTLRANRTVSSYRQLSMPKAKGPGDCNVIIAKARQS